MYLINVLRNESHSLLNVNNIMKSWIILDGLNLLVQTCRNPNLGLTTKAGVCKVVGQEGSWELHNILPGV